MSSGALESPYFFYHVYPTVVIASHITATIIIIIIIIIITTTTSLTLTLNLY